MTATHPFHWIAQVDQALLELEEKPQFGLSQEFDFEKLKGHLQQVLGCESLSIRQDVKGWIAPEQLFEGQAQDLKPLSIAWSTLNQSCYFAMDEQTLKQLVKELLGSEEGVSFVLAQGWIEGFYHYLATEVLFSLEQQGFASPLTPRLGDVSRSLPEEIGDQACFVVDVCLEINHKHCWGRLLLPQSFRREWKRSFGLQPQAKLSDEALEKMMVEIGLEVGHVDLNYKEWKEVSLRDFVVLDHCGYDPETKRGGVILNLQDKPIFRGRIKEEGIKLSGYPLYEEEEKMMEDDDLSDPELFEEPLEEEEESQPEGEEEPSSIEAELVESQEPSITPEQLPLRLTVEVGRIRMSAKELMNLAPGNLLDLQVSPDQGVDLVINGKKVGRGELIKMGDVLGVRILSL